MSKTHTVTTLHYLNSNNRIWKTLVVPEDAQANPLDVADQLCEDAIRNGLDRLVLIEVEGRVVEYFRTTQSDGAPYYQHLACERMGIEKAQNLGWNIQPKTILGHFEVRLNP